MSGTDDLAIGRTTRLLADAANGDGRAADALIPLVYAELRRQAQRLVAGGAGALQPTVLVHEAYLKLIGADASDWRSRTHFQAIAARAMRQVLVDHCRGEARAKRGGGWQRVTLSGVHAETGTEDVDLEALASALERLQEQDDRAATIVVLRFIGGLDERAVGEVLGISERTVRNDWRMARAWLRCELERSERP